MADQEKLGVAGEFDSEEFNRGLQRYMDSLLKAEKITDTVVAHLNRLGASLDKVIGSSAQLDKAAKEVDLFRKSLGAVSKALPDVKPLNKFFADVAKGAAVLKPVETTIRSLSSLNRSIVAISQASPISQAVLDSLKGLEPVITSLGNIPSLRPVARSIGELGLALERMSNVGDKPKAALDTLTSLGVRLKTISTNSADIRKVSTAISLIARAMERFQGIKGIPANALAGLGAIANALRAVSQVAGVKDAANQISLVSRALARFAQIKAIPTQSVATISALGNVLSSISKLSGIEGAAKALSGVGLAISRLANIKTIPAKALASIAAIGNALRSVSGIANVPQLSQGLLRLSTALNRLSTVKAVPPHVFQNLQALVRSLGGIGTGGNIAALVGVTNALTTALNRLSRAQATAIPQMERFRTSFTQGVALGVGIQAVEMFQRLGDAIRNFVSQTIGTVTFFERFDLTLKAVIARQIQAADATISQADALKQAEGPARGFFRILENIAIQSIFTPEDIALSFRLATAFGFTTEQALRLTQAIVDFTSFAGLGNEALERISRSLAQVRNRGKLTADNVRELAEAGVPVYDILGKAFGKTTAELLKLQEDGAIPAGQAINAIVEYFEQFEGAGERASNTVTGLLAKLGEIKQVAARDLFGEALKSIQPVLKELTEFLTSDTFRANIVALGQTIGANLSRSIQAVRVSIGGLISAFKALSPGTKEAIKTFIAISAIVVTIIASFGALSLIIGTLVNPFTVVVVAISGLATVWVSNFNDIQGVTTRVLSNITRLFDSVSRAAIGWGTNIIRSLTIGVSGAVNLVFQALSLVGRAFTTLLKPGSPPRLLPDLDKWGAEAANVYLEGWGKADFDELQKFGASLASQIRNLVGLGNIDELSAPRRIIGTRQALSQALSDIKSFGAVTEQTLQRIFNLTLLNRDLLKSYFDSYAQLTRATENLKKAQDALNDTMKRYDDQLKPLQKRLQAIQDAQEDAEEQKQVARLKRVIANRGATDSRRAAAILELERIETENQIETLEREKQTAQETGTTVVNELQKALDQAKENLAISEAKINDQLEINSLLSEEARIRRQMEEELAKQKDPRILALEKQLEVYTLQQEFLSNLIDLAHQQYIITSDDATQAQKKTAELRKQEILLDNQIKRIEAEKLGVNLDPLTGVPIVPLDFGIKGDEVDALGDLFDSFEGLSDLDVETPVKEFEAALIDAKRAVNEFGTSIQTTLQNINDSLPSFLRFRKTAEEINLGNIDETLPPSMQFSQGIEERSKSINGFQSALLILGSALAGTKVLSILRSLGRGFLVFGTKTNVITLVISTLATAWFENWFGIQEITANVISKVQEKLKELAETPFIQGIITGFTNLFNRITSFFKLLATSEGRAQAFESIKTGIKDLLLFTLDTAIITPEEFFRGLTALTEFGGKFVAFIIKGIGEAFGGFIEYVIGTVIPNVILAVGGIFKAIFIEIPKFILGLAKNFNENRGSLWQWILDAKDDTLLAFQEWLVSLENGLLVDIIPAIKEAGGSIIQGFTDGMNELLTTLGLPTLDEIGNKILDHILNFFGISGGESSETATKIGDPAGKGILGGLTQAIQDGLADLDIEFQDLFKTLTGSEDLNTLIYDSSITLGKGLVAGVIAGIGEKASEAQTAVEDFFKGLFGAGENEIEAGSPSKRAHRDLGEPIGEGVLGGLASALSEKSLESILNNALTTFNSLRDESIKVAGELETGVQATFVSLSLKLQAEIALIKTTFITNVNLMRTDGGLAITGFKTDTVTTFQGLQKALVADPGGIIPAITEQVVTFFTTMSEKVNKIVADLIVSLTEQLAGEGGLTSTLETQFVSKGAILGEAFGNGIAQGITNKLEPIKNAALHVIQQALLASLAVLNAQPGVGGSSVNTNATNVFNDRLGSPGTSSTPVIGGANVTKIYNLNVNSTQSSRGIARDFGIMEVMGA